MTTKKTTGSTGKKSATTTGTKKTQSKSLAGSKSAGAKSTKTSASKPASKTASTKGSSKDSEPKKKTKKSTEFDEYKKTRKKEIYDPVEFESFRSSERRREEAYQQSLKRIKVRDEVYIIAAALAAVLMILSYFNLCGLIGKGFNTLLFGLMGVFAYVFPFIFFAIVVFLVMNRRNFLVRRKVIFCLLAVICICSVIHIFTEYENVNLGKSFVVGYKKKVGGGFFGHLLAWPLCSLFGKVASVIIEITLLIISFMMLTGTAILSLIKQKSKQEYANMAQKRKENEEVRRRAEYEKNMQRLADNSIRNSSGLNHNNSDRPRIYAADSYNQSTIEATYAPKKTRESFLDKLKSGKTETKTKTVAATKVEAKPEKQPAHELDMVEISSDVQVAKNDESIYMQEMARKFGGSQSSEPTVATPTVQTPHAYRPEEIFVDREEEFEPVIRGVDIVSDVNDSKLPVMSVSKPETGNFGVSRDGEGKSSHSGVFARGDYRPQGTPEVKSHSLAGKQETASVSPSDNADSIKIVKRVPKENKPYVFPPLSKLAKPAAGARGMTSVELKETANKLQETLKSFGVNVTITNISCGPSVTRYELQPEQGVKVSKITSLTDDIKLNLAAADIRMEAPIPGKAAIGIEVPNKVNQMVYFSSLVSSNEFSQSKSNLTFAVGKDLGGQVIVTDIEKMPHLLIAGATGSGKSVCINTLIMSILYKSSPEDVRLILIDPKVVELSVYNGIPHLLIPVVTDPKKASAALNWAVMEMTDRYKKFADLGVRNLEGYNKRIANQKEPEKSESGEIYEKLPQIVIVVDELADLMMVAPGEVEDYICRLAQLARAAGIHLVIATQRPSVNVITGLIKANVPSRVAFAVASQVDSRTILDMGGAEKLLGKGDMLFYPAGYPKPVRIQGAYVSDSEVASVVEFIKSHNDDNYNPDVEEKMKVAETTSKNGGNNAKASAEPANEYDEYLYMAGSFIIQKEKASIGGLQRQFKIGFNRAARIMDQLCEMGVVGPEEGTKPRQILMTLDAFEHFAVNNGLK